jgi:hypothetical protein
MVQPSEIAASHVLLAAEASFVTGAALAADGGGRAPIQAAARHPQSQRATIGLLTRHPNCLANSLSSECGTTLS